MIFVIIHFAMKSNPLDGCVYVNVAKNSTSHRMWVTVDTDLIDAVQCNECAFFSFFRLSLALSLSLSFSIPSLWIWFLTFCRRFSIVRYHFRPYSYYPHSTLIMFDTEASVRTNSGDGMNSCAMLINFYCTIHLQPTYLQNQFFLIE